MAAGHIYIVAIVTVVQVMTFKEIIAIANVPSREKKLQFTKSLNWYFLATTMYFLYGESVIYYFKHILLVDAFLLPLATHHRFISFILYIIGKPCMDPCFNKESLTESRQASYSLWDH
jgi:phosphatidate cytidylyltransferase